MFGMIGGLVGVQRLVSDRSPRFRWRAFALIGAGLMLEQVRPFPESFDKRTEFLERVESLVPELMGVDTAWVLYDDSMPDYRHEIAAMWAGLRAKTPVMNGFSGTVPPGFPGLQARPTIEECVAILGPNWHGRVALVEWGPPVTRRVYQIDVGGRIRLLSSS
jgi:hypothetical protein